ncbi:MAG: response regulator transcription factor [Anaerolineales bacterium]|nr:response regulator transcription factor [Anaerolineales bacterium]
MRILIADNQPKVRFALRVTLERQPGFKTIGEVIDAADLLAQAKAICPDLTIIDWELTGMTIAELIGALRHECHALRVIILSSRPETREQALAAGANAFVCKCDAPDELFAALNECLWQEDPSINSNEVSECSD